MLKKIILLLLFFHLFSVISFASQDLQIISREQWGANEDYRYLESEEWKNIILQRKQNKEKELTLEQKKEADKYAKKVKIANNFLTNTYPSLFSLSETVKTQGDNNLAWPIYKSKNKTSIVIHHTDGNYTDSYEAIKNIYKSHSINNQWGDIGYNYIIGLDGEIFEGRAGGDYVVGAHAKWNNISSIGIAVIGNYDGKKLSTKQLESLEKLVSFLKEKYSIDFSKKQYFFKWCVSGDQCDDKPIDVSYDYPIIGHRDSGHTNCPGDELYEQLSKMKNKLIIKDKTKGNETLEKIFTRLQKIREDKLLDLLLEVELLIGKDISKKKENFLNLVKNTILDIENIRNELVIFDSDSSFDDNKKIKIKLSYPDKKNIHISLSGKYKPELKKQGKEYILGFLKSDENKNYELRFSLKQDKLFLNSKEVIGFDESNFFRIKSPDNYFLTISSRERKPSWDSSGKINDNKFKGDIVLYTKDNSFVVVNDINLIDYLKGLGEVSDNENIEKTRAIIILARTYAKWYIDKSRKFPGEWYDGIDDPDVFQKYLGFSYELRSPSVEKVVDKTKGIIITYGGELIKPWYFSQSDGETLSYKEYCNKNIGDNEACFLEFPFLSSVFDPSGVGKTRLGHGVGVSGSGLKYLSDRGWSAEMMIKYFLKGVEIEKLN